MAKMLSKKAVIFFFCPILLFQFSYIFSSATDPYKPVVIAFECDKLQQGNISNLIGIPKNIDLSINRLWYEGVAKWGDRGFYQDLNAGSLPEVIVPLVCGAAGNCSWGIYQLLQGIKDLGIIAGQFVFLPDPDSAWPNIETFSRLGSGEGIFQIYSMEGGEYRLKKERNLSRRKGTRLLNRWQPLFCDGI